MIGVECQRASMQQAGFLPSVLLLFVFYALLRAARHSMWRIAWLALPGTIAHELLHFVIGLVLRARPHSFSVWPRRNERGRTLGSVAFASIGLLNGAVVTLAPLLLLPVAWLCLVHVLLPLWSERRRAWWLLAGYLAATALLAALPSFQDLKVGAPSLLLYLAPGGLLLFAYKYV
jgi:hypothetical protein